jgi:hypothetical protein
LQSIRWVGWGGAAALGGGIAAIFLGANFEDARASTDRQTVDCLAHQLTPGEKQQIAHFADANDFDSIWHMYDGAFHRCLVRADQRDRKRQLTAIAWRILSKDPEFVRLRDASAAHKEVASRIQTVR